MDNSEILQPNEMLLFFTNASSWDVKKCFKFLDLLSTIFFFEVCNPVCDSNITPSQPQRSSLTKNSRGISVSFNT